MLWSSEKPEFSIKDKRKRNTQLIHSKWAMYGEAFMEFRIKNLEDETQLKLAYFWVLLEV